MESVKWEPDYDTKMDMKPLLEIENNFDIKYPIKLELPVLKVENYTDFKIKEEENYCIRREQDTLVSAEEVVGTDPSCSNLEKEDRHNNTQIPENVWRKQKIKKNGVKKMPKCNLCNEYFATLSTLKMHMPLHTGKFPFVCEICKKGFSREPHLTRHMYSHTGDRPFVCHVCQAAFCRNDILKKHIMSHKLSVAPLKSYKCDYCNKVFMVKYSMQLHILRHMKIKMVECEFCKKKFLKKSCLQRHLYTHTGVKPFVCGKCNIGFVRKNDYESHVVTHFGEKRYNCDMCSRGYARKTELMKHILSHTGNVMKCNVCDFVFHSFKDYQQHKHVHVSTAIIGKHVEGGEPFTCDICTGIFQTKHSFLNHISYYRKRHARISRKIQKNAKNRVHKNINRSISMTKTQ